MKSKLKGAVVLITGANGGMGTETVKLLLKKDVDQVILACRTQAKADETKRILGSDNRLIAVGGFDMQDQNSISKAIGSIELDKTIDIVFLQAGGMVVSKDFQFVSANGQEFEKTTYQNVIGGFIVTEELKQRGMVSENCRFLYAGGEGARGIKGMIKKPEFKSAKDLTAYIHKGNGSYSDIDALGTSKFMSALLVQEMAERDSLNEYVWFSPGLTAGTKGLINVPQPKKFMMENFGFPMMKLFGIAQGPVAAATKYVDALDGKYGQSGDLIGAPEGKGLGNLVDQKPMNEGFTNHNLRGSFWQIANGIIK